MDANRFSRKARKERKGCGAPPKKTSRTSRTSREANKLTSKTMRVLRDQQIAGGSASLNAFFDKNKSHASHASHTSHEQLESAKLPRRQSRDCRAGRTREPTALSGLGARLGRYCPRTDKHSRRCCGAKRAKTKEVKYIVPYSNRDDDDDIRDRDRSVFPYRQGSE